jgi:hypothetical protein
VRRSRKLAATLLAISCVTASGGCGSSDTSTSSTTPTTEVAQRLPKLPPGWRARRDRSIGYAIGIPPGWELNEHGGTVLFRSPDHLVAVTLAVDRNGDALELPLGRFATQTLSALPGFQDSLQPAKPQRFPGTPLDAAWTTATGKAKRGLAERATVVVLRRDALVDYAVALVENAERAESQVDRAVALAMVRTLRDQPVAASVSP